MTHEDSWTISTRAGPPLMQVYGQFAAYRKGPFEMYALREYLGEGLVNDALRRLFDRFKSGEPPLPTTRDLYGELVAVTPDSLRPFLGDLFERNTWWEVQGERACLLLPPVQESGASIWMSCRGRS
jgi:ABC-2 type transport system permease protein